MSKRPKRSASPSEDEKQSELSNVDENPDILAELERTAPDVLRNLQRTQKQKLVRSVQQVCLHFRGPLPPPSILAEYNNVLPNGAERIMKMAEDQSAHRIEMEKTVVNSQQRQSERGQVFGLVIGLAALGCALAATWMGHPGVGVTVGGTTVVSLVGVFIYGKKSMQRERSAKAQGARPGAKQARRS